MKRVFKTHSRFFSVGMIAALCFFAGCGDDSADDKSSNNGSAAQNTTAAAEIKIQNFAFSPAALQVKVGDTIKVTNLDAMEHTVTAVDNSFDTKLLAKDASAIITLSKAGTFPFVCTPHASSMKGTITVE